VKTLAIVASIAAIPAHAQQSYYGQSESLGAMPPFQEIYQDPDDPLCAIYVNHFQRPLSDEEVWDSPAGPVSFKFFRGEADIPDQVVAWDVPEGYAVLPYTLTREEHETGQFCIVEYVGG
jgi:hypothetical protein